ncbi:hypothetical protein [Cardinium endosymbiont of Philonthus spinipes]|uniref:hypothetical protein n=1 Tax=Cardinium endosymbiont of Philonthus spinipes TaxID=3077941 RepID=UPI00313E53D5
MQYSYKSTLVYLVTVVSVVASCDKSSEKEKIQSVSYGYPKPKETLNEENKSNPEEENKSNPEEEKNNNPNQNQEKDPNETTENRILQELQGKFKTLFDSKIEICYKKAIMASIKSLIYRMNASTQIQNKENNLYAEQLDINSIDDKLKKRMGDHFSSFKQKVKDWCLTLPLKELEHLVTCLDNYPPPPETSETNKQANKFLDKCHEIASGPACQQLNDLTIEQFNTKWELIADYFKDPEILAKMPPACQDTIQNSVKECGKKLMEELMEELMKDLEKSLKACQKNNDTQGNLAKSDPSNDEKRPKEEETKSAVKPTNIKDRQNILADKSLMSTFSQIQDREKDAKREYCKQNSAQHGKRK